ncbi:MAG: hypothetical protein ABIJ04_00755 [Bacteroidota bacterium]
MGLTINFTNLGVAMKKKLSGLGILLMLALKNPPMPELALFQKISIVEVRCFSLKRIALQFCIN